MRWVGLVTRSRGNSPEVVSKERSPGSGSGSGGSSFEAAGDAAPAPAPARAADAMFRGKVGALARTHYQSPP
jgi:hypothetical protein